MCSLCLALAIAVLFKKYLTPQTVLLLVMVTAGAFFMATLVDLIAISMFRPIRWNAWLLFCMTAALFFFLCAGLLFPMMEKDQWTWFLCMGIANALTGVIFLIEVLWIAT